MDARRIKPGDPVLVYEVTPHNGEPDTLTPAGHGRFVRWLSTGDAQVTLDSGLTQYVGPREIERIINERQTA